MEIIYNISYSSSICNCVLHTNPLEEHWKWYILCDDHFRWFSATEALYGFKFKAVAIQSFAEWLMNNEECVPITD